MADLLRKYLSLYSSTTNSFGTGTGVTITPNTVVGLPTDTEITLTFDRQVAGKLERIIGTISGGNFVPRVRGADGTTEQAHTSPTVEMIWNAADENDSIDWALAEHTQTGAHKETALDSMIAGTEARGDVIVHNGTIWSRLALGATGKALVSDGTDAVWGDVASFWANVPGTPTRVSDTQFTITDTSNTNKYDLLFKKGVLLKWDESGTFQTAMVISSSYSSNAVTINIVGDSLTAGFTLMKYAIPEALVKTFPIVGTLPASATTGISYTWITESDMYFLSADLVLDTAGSGAGSTVVDINDDGSTKWTTKPTITTTGTTDLDNVADNPSTAVAAGSEITVDVDSTVATAPSDAYVKVYYYPVSWRYR